MHWAKDAFLQLTAGGSAGLVEISLMHPLDLVKTRFQVQRTGHSTSYTSLIGCFRDIYKQEGFLSFYKGILPPILAEMPKRAIKTFSLAGLCSGLTEALAVQPFEVIKIRLQADRNVTIHQQMSTAQLAREIARVDGWGSKGLYRGVTATLMRHGVWNMCYFGIYHSIKLHYPPPTDSSTMTFVHRFCVGLLAGTIASIANIPFDVAKSRIQGPQPEAGKVKYYGCFRTLAIVYKEEGFLALYKGLLPKCLRLGPGGAVLMIVYESAYGFLSG